MKTEEKTVREWLNTLKEPYKSKALKQTNSYTSKETTNYISSALYKAFDWNDSEEGWEYWNDLTSSLENKEI
jgi:hypothetical protein